MKVPAFIKRFLRCGLAGWCMEIIFTAANALRRRDFTLKGCTSLWMFPIYGSASFLYPLFCLMKKTSVWVRGFLYMLLIFFAEFVSGSYLKKKDLCPWDYNHSKWNIGKVIRLDYAPLWFLAGLFFEHFTTKNTTKDRPCKK